MPPPIGPSSRTTTDFPARASKYAVVIPAIPAPTTQTFARAFLSNGGRLGMLAVVAQTEIVVPDSVFIFRSRLRSCIATCIPTVVVFLCCDLVRSGVIELSQFHTNRSAIRQ